MRHPQVCNNLGQCHCDDGYAPPRCDTAGSGGSMHSGPANAPSNPGIVRYCNVIVLIIIVVIIIEFTSKQSTSRHHVISTNCASKFRLFHHLSARGDLVVPRTRLQLRNRAFRVAGPVAWNSLPLDIHSAPTLSTFKNMLKTHLY